MKVRELITSLESAVKENPSVAAMRVVYFDDSDKVNSIRGVDVELEAGCVDLVGEKEGHRYSE